MIQSKQRHFVLIWLESYLRGSYMTYLTRWRPFVTYLTVKEIVKEHEGQFGSGCVVDVIDVDDPDNIHSCFEENV